MTTRQVNDLIIEGTALKDLAEAYADIASLKIRKIRSKVESNRVFYEELTKLYGLIKHLASQQKILLVKPKKIVTVLITSNYRFYGSITSQLIQYFILNSSKIDTDIIIIGKSAQEFFKTSPLNRSYQTIIFKDDLPQIDEVKKLTQMVNGYEKVLVCYPQLKTLLVQTPIFKDLTEFQKQSKPGKEEIPSLFIFEPEIEKILNFFDSQIISSLLQHAFLESELARMAARLISMDEAKNNADEFIKQYEKMLILSERSEEDTNQLERITTVFAFRMNQIQ